jgi:peroxiredoxin
METTLRARFRALEEARGREWSPAQLAQNRAQRRALLDAFDPAAAVGVGDRLPDAPFLDLAGNALTLSQTVGRGPAVLVFFRFATCPADAIALPHYDRALADAGVPVLAISPQVPDRLAAIRRLHELRLRVVSDPGGALAERLGLNFVPIDVPEPPPAGWIGEVTGTGTWKLPQTSVLIVDGDLVVRWAAIDPDWLDRVEAQDVLAALAALRRADAA